MTDPQARRAALIAAACLIGPTVPGGIVDRRPDEAAKALTRMADMLLPWLEDEPPASITAQPGIAATATPGIPVTGEEAQHDRSERPSP